LYGKGVVEGQNLSYDKRRVREVNAKKSMFEGTTRKRPTKKMLWREGGEEYVGGDQNAGIAVY